MVPLAATTIMDPMEVCLENKDWSGLARRGEETELSCAASDKLAPQNVYGALLAVYLLLRDLENAKFLWKRMPPSYKEATIMGQIWEIGQCLWRREFENAHEKLRQSWPAHVRPLMVALEASLHDEVLAVVGNCYSRISTEQLSGMLGMKDVAEACRELGWTVDGAFVQPKRVCPETVSLWKDNKTRLLSLTSHISTLEN